MNVKGAVRTAISSALRSASDWSEKRIDSSKKNAMIDSTRCSSTTGTRRDTDNQQYS
jgi:hypothetical protein